MITAMTDQDHVNPSPIFLTEEESALWDRADERGEEYRCSVRREARTIAARYERTIEILSSDSITIDAVGPS